MEWKQIPEEVWLHIFSFLQHPLHDEDRAAQETSVECYHTGWRRGRGEERLSTTALAQLCRTCQAFRRIAEPLLYNALRLSWHDFSHTRDERTRALQQLIAQAVRTLTRRPQLCQEVRGLRLHAETRNPDEESPLPELFALAKQRFALPEGLEHQITDSLRQAAPAGEVCFFLALLPALGTLDLVIKDLNQDLWKRLFASDGGMHYFPDLKEARMRYYHDMSEQANVGSIFHVDIVLQHPGLETFRTYNFTWSEEDLGRKNAWSNNASNIRRLHLVEAEVDGAGLKDMLVRCPRLEALELHFGSSRRWDHDDELCIRDFGKSLQSHGQHLRELEIRIEDSPYWEQGRWSGSIGRFIVDLQNLKELRLPFNILCGWEGPYPGPQEGDIQLLGNCLPKYLEVLDIFWTHTGQAPMDEVMSQIRDLLIVRNEKCRQLREIRLNTCEDDEEDFQAAIRAWDESGDLRLDWAVRETKPTDPDCGRDGMRGYSLTRRKQATT